MTQSGKLDPPSPRKIGKYYYKGPVVIFASSPCVFAFAYVLEYAWAAVWLLGGFPSHLVTKRGTSFGNTLSCLRCFLLLPGSGTKWKKQRIGDNVAFSFGGNRNRHLWKFFGAHYYSGVTECVSIDCRI